MRSTAMVVVILVAVLTVLMVVVELFNTEKMVKIDEFDVLVLVVCLAYCCTTILINVMHQTHHLGAFVRHFGGLNFTFQSFV